MVQGEMVSWGGGEMSVMKISALSKLVNRSLNNEAEMKGEERERCLRSILVKWEIKR
jgi:hypothetical protein